MEYAQPVHNTHNLNVNSGLWMIMIRYRFIACNKGTTLMWKVDCGLCVQYFLLSFADGMIMTKFMPVNLMG